MGIGQTGYNPYEPPRAPVADTTTLVGDVEADRRRHLGTEASVRSIGLLYLVGAWLCVASLFFVVVLMAFSYDRMPQEDQTAALVGIAFIVVLYGAIAALNFWVGRGLRAFRRGPRLFVLVVAWVGLIGFPVGTMISAYFLYLLLSEKGKRVFEPDYPAVIAATPSIRYRSPWWLLLVFVLFGLCAVLGIWFAVYYA